MKIYKKEKRHKQDAAFFAILISFFILLISTIAIINAQNSNINQKAIKNEIEAKKEKYKIRSVISESILKIKDISKEEILNKNSSAINFEAANLSNLDKKKHFRSDYFPTLYFYIFLDEKFLSLTTDANINCTFVIYIVSKENDLLLCASYFQEFKLNKAK